MYMSSPFTQATLNYSGFTLSEWGHSVRQIPQVLTVQCRFHRSSRSTEIDYFLQGFENLRVKFILISMSYLEAGIRIWI